MVRILILLILFLTSCSTSKQVIAPVASIPKPTYLQPDTCLTDKQLKTYLNFVKDSMKIENQRTKIEYKYIRDTIRITEKTKRTNILQDNKTVRDTTKQAEKTNRTQIRQEEKTKRTKWWVWFLFGFGTAIILNFGNR